MSKVSTAFVLAGGLGTRLSSVIADRPKAMGEVAGSPFLEHLLNYWISQGITEFVLCTGYMADSISSHFGESYRGCRIKYSVEISARGTGGALSAALLTEQPQGNFLVLNGDTYFPIPLNVLEDHKELANSQWALSLFKSLDAQRYSAVSLDDSGYVTSIGTSDHSTLGTQAEVLVNGGVSIGQAESFVIPGDLDRGPFSVEERITEILKLGSKAVSGEVFYDAFIDIGTPKDFELAQIMDWKGFH